MVNKCMYLIVLENTNTKKKKCVFMYNLYYYNQHLSCAHCRCIFMIYFRIA